MKQLRVTTPFRDENNFFLLHEVGDVIAVNDSRAARLVEGGLCEECAKEAKEEKPVEPSASEAVPQPSPEPVKKTRKTTKRQ